MRKGKGFEEREREKERIRVLKWVLTSSLMRYQREVLSPSFAGGSFLQKKKRRNRCRINEENGKRKEKMNSRADLLSLRFVLLMTRDEKGIQQKRNEGNRRISLLFMTNAVVFSCSFSKSSQRVLVTKHENTWKRLLPILSLRPVPLRH